MLLFFTISETGKLSANNAYIIEKRKNLLWLENPNCLHTTLASGAPQPLSHTVPHWL